MKWCVSFEKYKHPEFYVPVRPRGPLWADLEDSDIEPQKAYPSAIPIAAALKSIIDAYEQRNTHLTQEEITWVTHVRRQHQVSDKAYAVAIPYDHVLVDRAAGAVALLHPSLGDVLPAASLVSITTSSKREQASNTPLWLRKSMSVSKSLSKPLLRPTMVLGISAQCAGRSALDCPTQSISVTAAGRPAAKAAAHAFLSSRAMRW